VAKILLQFDIQTSDGVASLDKIKEAFDENADLLNLLLAPFFQDAISERQAAWRRGVSSTPPSRRAWPPRISLQHNRHSQLL